jgi:hypothetical protein
MLTATNHADASQCLSILETYCIPDTQGAKALEVCPWQLPFRRHLLVVPSSAQGTHLLIRLTSLCKLIVSFDTTSAPTHLPILDNISAGISMTMALQNRSMSHWIHHSMPYETKQIWKEIPAYQNTSWSKNRRTSHARHRNAIMWMLTYANNSISNMWMLTLLASTCWHRGTTPQQHNHLSYNNVAIRCQCDHPNLFIATHALALFENDLPGSKFFRTTIAIPKTPIS